MPAPTASPARRDKMGLIVVEAEVGGRSGHVVQVSGRVRVGATVTLGKEQPTGAAAFGRLSMFAFASRL